MRAVIYTRVSTDDQGDNYSLPTQLEACRRYATQHGWTVVAELEDVMSGAILDRPGLTKARQVIAAGGADALIVYSQDRLTRSVAHMLLLRDELKAASVQLHAVSRGQSADTPEGRLFDTIEASFAEYERLKIKERVARGKKGKIEAGIVMGSTLAPFGYRYEGRNRDRRLVIDETEAAAVRQIFAWYTSKVPVLEIVRRLDATGVLKPSATRETERLRFHGAGTARRDGWARGSVYSLLRTTTYVGEMHYPQYGLTVAVPAILDRSIWEAVQARLDVGSLRARRNTTRAYMLRTRMRCSCGAAMVGRTIKNRQGHEHRYYQCNAVPHNAVRPCPYEGKGKMVRAASLEVPVWDWIVSDVLDEGRILEAVDRQHESFAERRAALESERAAYQRQIDAAADKVSKVVQLFTAGVLTLDEVTEQKRAIDAARGSAQAELARVDSELQRTGPAAGDVEEVTAIARQIRAKLEEDGVSDATKARMIELLDVRVSTVREGGIVAWIDVQCQLTLSSSRLPIASTGFDARGHNRQVVFRTRLPLAA